MKRTWDLAVKIRKKENLNTAYLFLVLQIVRSILLSIVPGMLLGIVLYEVKQTAIWFTMFVFAGYAAVFVGFFGGILFLMQKNFT